MFTQKLAQAMKDARRAVTLEERSEALDELLRALSEIEADYDVQRARLAAQEELEMRRRAAAESAYAVFDFGREVVDDFGWDMTSGEDEWSKLVFLEGVEDTNLVVFVVRFKKDSAEIVEAFLRE